MAHFKRTKRRSIPFWGLLLLLFTCNNITFAQSASTYDIIELDKVKVDSDNDGMPDLMGDTVRVGGRATVASGKLHERFLQIFIQSDTTGLSLFSRTIDEEVNRGDSLIATGVVQQYYGLTELKVLNYHVFPSSGKAFDMVPLNKAMENLAKYEGSLVSGSGTVVGKGEQFNGKYLMFAPDDNAENSIMVYVTNFHSDYNHFDFESISIGDDLKVTGILSLYNPDAQNQVDTEPTFKLHLRTAQDLNIIGLSENQLLFWSSIGGILLLIVIAWIFSLRSTVKSQTKDLKQSLQEKEILLKEIHHRVKNNLAMMSAMFELQMDGTKSEEARQVLESSQSRLKSMALVHDKLYNTSTLTDIEMSQYIKELVKSLHNTFEEEGQDIKLSFDFDDIYLNLDQAIPCGLIINEIVVNSFKHAFIGKDKGEIRISMKNKGNALVLTVADTGEGIPDDFSIEESHSLGMMLIDTFKKQLEADLKISNKNGAKFTLTFPKK
ncbi:MAG: histidine kinase dimerization/phosphoacceptor domain -containing protein [Balneolaceae bacterium]|nr:histidine kinase dimerization/phosphoacceptor domain -containing protein [Balneolaceae bacterium]